MNHPSWLITRKRILHAIRRAHLYFGLFLVPWAVLYGVTGFLFNHPTAFSDQPTASFGPDALAGTALDDLPSATVQAEEVVKRLNEKQKPATPYRLAGEAKYSREFAFATVKSEGQTVGVLIDVKNRRGTVRTAVPESPKALVEKAPFAMDRTNDAPRFTPPREPSADAIRLEPPMHERVKAAIPAILERTGFPGGEVTVTSVPDLTFPIEVERRIWMATYNPTTGSVSGKPAEAEEKPAPSARRFLTRLHSAHGYPGEADARWYWAILVDAMAFALCFWSFTGLVMWWQVKAARRLGSVVLLLSAAAAAALGFGMYALVAAG